MALADYFERDAQAVSQVVAGFDAEAFRARMSGLEVGLAFGPDVQASSEGCALADLLVRLLARFYPSLSIFGPSGAMSDDLARLAQAINPAIEHPTRRPAVGVVIGLDAKPFRRSVFAGSNGWAGSANMRAPLAVGKSDHPFGPGIAACLCAGLLFRILVGNEPPSGETASLSGSSRTLAKRRKESFDGQLVGAGAIGHAAAWTLARTPDEGRLDIIDPETIELSNVQRYVMATRADEGATKAPFLASAFGGSLHAESFEGDWAAFVESHGFQQPLAMLALDSAGDRRAAQWGLPRRIINAWTQPGDLGVSAHSQFGGEGACVDCLYVPDSRQPNEDEIYAAALGVPARLEEVRTLLHQGSPVGDSFLDAVAVGLDRPRELLASFAGAQIRELYVRGICGGGILPLGSTGRVRAAVHVPLAHQSALAGVLLAARAVETHRTNEPAITEVTQLDILRSIPPHPTHPRRPRLECVCRDPDYVKAFRAKWSAARPLERDDPARGR